LPRYERQRPYHNKLREAFAPESLEVIDESHLHEGHAGHRPGGETHFRVYIVSPAFQGKSRIERHRMINATLAKELASSVHALAIKSAGAGEAAEVFFPSRVRKPKTPCLPVSVFLLELGSRARHDPKRGDAIALAAQDAKAEAVEGETLAAFGIDRAS